MKGLLLSLALLLLVISLIVADSLAVGAAVEKLETAISEAEQNGIETAETLWESYRFLFTVSLPRYLIEDMEEGLLSLRLALEGEDAEDKKKEKEELLLCLSLIRRRALPHLAEFL